MRASPPTILAYMQRPYHPEMKGLVIDHLPLVLVSRWVDGGGLSGASGQPGRHSAYKV